MADKPMNPFATEDFANAMKESLEKWSKDLGKIGEQIQKNLAEDKVTFMTYDDMYSEYGGRVRLEKSTMWEMMVDTLICNGYEVTVRLEEATETEKEMDGASTFVVIEFDEVE